MRIVFADDHTLVRESVTRVLQALGPNTEILEAGTFDEALGKAATGQTPDMIILDLDMPGMNRFHGVRAMRSRYPATPLVILTGVEGTAEADTAIAAGAVAYLPKTLDAEGLLAALRKVLAGERLPPPPGRDPDASGLRDGAPGGLTAREIQVLACLVRGQTNKEIARTLDVQEITVKVHMRGIFRKLSVSNRVQAVARALDLGIGGSRAT